MITVERIVEVDRPIEAIFAYLADFTHTEQWDPGTVRTTRVDVAPLSVGARFHNVSQFRGRRTELDYVLKVYDLDKHLVFTGNNKTVEATDDLSLRSDRPGTTTITYRAHFRFKGVARLAEPYLRPKFGPIADDTVAQLARTLTSVL